MKKNYIEMLAAMVMLGLSACSNEEDIPQMDVAEGLPVCFRVSTDGMQSRTSHEDANTIDRFGLRIQSNSEEVVYRDQTITFTGSGEGDLRIWTPDLNIGWRGEIHTVDMIACYPNLFDFTNPFETTAFVRVETDQTADSYASDVMIAQISDFDPATVTADNPAVDLRFRHVMSQLQLVLTFPEGTTPEQISGVQTVSVGGCSVRAELFPTRKKGVVDHPADDKMEVNAYRSAATGTTASFRCIMIPQRVASGGLTVSFVFNGKYYEWTSDQEITLAENTVHTLNLTVNYGAPESKSLQSRSWGDTTDNCPISNSIN